MTCKEKFEEKYPNVEVDVCEMCPDDYGIAPIPKELGGCGKTTCVACWDREVPEPTIKSNLSDFTVDISEPVEPTIKDSGERTQFESGAVRDMRAGKGRCDLMPLEVVANYICPDNDSNDHILWNLNMFQKTNSTSFLYSAISIFEMRAYKDTYTMLLEVAKHYEEGAKKYGHNNWQKGIPTWCYIDSATRHYLKWLRGDKDEPHDRAFVWNLLCCIWEVDHRTITTTLEKESS